jgi:protein TonB
MAQSKLRPFDWEADMPASMFDDLVSPHAGPASPARRWYTLPISFLIHSAVLVVLVVIPLIATDVLPAPRLTMAFVTPSHPALPQIPPAPRRMVVAPAAERDPNAPPLDTPTGIAPEPSVIREPETFGAETPGLIAGLGSTVVEAVPRPLPPTPPASDARPVRVSTLLTPPTKLRDAAPVYPSIAQSARVQGDVIIEATIGIDGKVQNARILRSVPLLDQAAVAAVRSWEYTPTLLNGQPVAVIMTVTVRFRIH